MFSTKLSVVPNASPLVAAVCALSFVVAGCSTTPEPDKTATWSPNKIYAEAKDEASSGAYDKAIPLTKSWKAGRLERPSRSRPRLKRPMPSTKAVSSPKRSQPWTGS